MIKLQMFVMAVCLSFSTAGFAQNIVVFSPEATMFSTKAAAQLSAQVSQELAPQGASLQVLGEAIQDLQQQRADNGSLMSTDELQQLESDIQKKTIEYNQIQQYIGRVEAQYEDRFIQTIRPKLDVVMRRYIGANDVDIIINSSALVYVDAEIDITAEITRMLDQEH